MERALLHHALTQISMAAGDGGFHAPSLDEFFPDYVLFAGTPFALNRIMLIRLLVMVVLVLFIAGATRSLKVVPRRGSSVVEFPFNFVRNSIAFETLGEKDGRRYLPLLTTIFFVTLGMNLTSVIPFLNIAGTAVIGLPLLMAVISWVAFIYAGLKKHPAAFIRNSLFP